MKKWIANKLTKIMLYPGLDKIVGNSLLIIFIALFAAAIASVIVTVNAAHNRMRVRWRVEVPKRYQIWCKIYDNKLTYEEWLDYKGVTMTVDNDITNYNILPSVD